jgi:hypothetical protein
MRTAVDPSEPLGRHAPRQEETDYYAAGRARRSEQRPRRDVKEMEKSTAPLTTAEELKQMDAFG